QCDSNPKLHTRFLTIIEQFRAVIDLTNLKHVAAVEGTGAIAYERGVSAGEGGYAAARDIVISQTQSPLQKDEFSLVSQPQLKFLEAAIEDYSEWSQRQLSTRWSSNTSPYKGLFSYQTMDKDNFFGREKEVVQLMEYIQDSGKQSKVTVLYGASGVGKTSLIQAGIIPRLVNAIPLYALPTLGSSCQGPDDTIRKRILDAFSRTNILRSDLSHLSLHQFLSLVSHYLNGKTLIICLDQFEKFFISTPHEAQQKFISSLAQCYDDQILPVKFVLSLRKEYFSDLDIFRQAVPTIFYNYMKLEPLDFDQAAWAIEEPLKKRGIEYDSKLVQEILNDLSKYDFGESKIEPPQLQIVCRHLFEAGLGTKLTIGDYYRLGRATGILSAHLSLIMNRFGPDRQILIYKILAALITEDNDSISLTQHQLEAEINEGKLDVLLAELIDERLLRHIETTDGVRYELAHQYLVKDIKKTISEEEWRLKEVKDLLKRELINWHNNPESVIPADRLQIIEQWCANGRLVVNEEAATLIELSRLKVDTLNRERMNLIQSIRMDALEHLVVGIDCEMSSPVAA
ncbi:ATP-binding protein, partial [Candidatus Saccharibacteria bacterium]|nr:ATP-binding protein [Candidatus Saccharibacteria bacterium]